MLVCNYRIKCGQDCIFQLGRLGQFEVQHRAYKYCWATGRERNTRPNILCIIEVNQRKPWQPWLQHNIIDLYICHQLIRKTTGNTTRGQNLWLCRPCQSFLSLCSCSCRGGPEPSWGQSSGDADCSQAKVSGPSPHHTSRMQIKGENKKNAQLLSIVYMYEPLFSQFSLVSLQDGTDRQDWLN